MTNRAHVLLWTDNTTAYLDAIKAAGLADRVAIDTLPRKDKPSAEQLSRTEALMATAVPPGVLPSMKKLRWAQAMSAAVPGVSLDIDVGTVDDAIAQRSGLTPQQAPVGSRGITRERGRQRDRRGQLRDVVAALPDSGR